MTYMSICYYLEIPQCCYLLILCYSIWSVLIPGFCIHLDFIVFTYVQMYLGSYLSVCSGYIIIIIGGFCL